MYVIRVLFSWKVCSIFINNEKLSFCWIKIKDSSPPSPPTGLLSSLGGWSPTLNLRWIHYWIKSTLRVRRSFCLILKSNQGTFWTKNRAWPWVSLRKFQKVPRVFFIHKKGVKETLRIYGRLLLVFYWWSSNTSCDTYAINTGSWIFWMINEMKFLNR